MLQIKIGQHLDKYGFCGRQWPPENSDVGLYCDVVAADVMYLEITQDDEKKTVSDILSDGESIDYEMLEEFTSEDYKALRNSTVTCFYAVTPDNRLLEVMEHEVEAVSLIFA